MCTAFIQVWVQWRVEVRITAAGSHSRGVSGAALPNTRHKCQEEMFPSIMCGKVRGWQVSSSLEGEAPVGVGADQ